MKTAKPYRVSFDLKSGIKQHLKPCVMEVDAINAKEAIKIVQKEAERIYKKHAFHCKAKRKE